MTSIALPKPIDPNKTYPVLVKFPGAGYAHIREMSGSYLLSEDNPNQHLYYNVQLQNMYAQSIV